MPAGRVVIFDHDHYYMGSVLAEQLAGQDRQVTLVTPAPLVSFWSGYTLEQRRIQQRLLQMGVVLHTQQTLTQIQAGAVTLFNAASGKSWDLPCDGVLLLTDRLPEDRLYRELKDSAAGAGIETLQVIGDADAPSIIAQAVFSGNLVARDFDEKPSLDRTPFRIERVGQAFDGLV